VVFLGRRLYHTNRLQKLKVKYSELMVRLSLHSKKYLECAKACRVILGSPFVDSELTFTQAVLFALLAPYSKEQHELVHQLVQDKRIKSLPILADLLRTFMKRELIRWQAIESIIQSSNVFSMDLLAKAGWITDLQRRVIEHNVRIVSELYSRITLQRMSELLNLDAETAESTLTDLINARTVTAKIDRFDGIVTFLKSRAGGASDNEHALLNQWSSQIDALLALMVKTNHMISKEETTQSIKQQQSS
jgi:26S proteasome regulatory subunit N5